MTCKGFQRVRSNEVRQIIEEKLYAELPDGTILETEWVTFSPHFNPPRRKWERTDFIPGEAKFIGNYPAPKESL